MANKDWKITIGRNSYNTKVEYKGEVVKNLKRVNIDVAASGVADLPIVTLELYGVHTDIVQDGEVPGAIGGE